MSERSVRRRLIVGASVFAAIAIGLALLGSHLVVASTLHQSAVSLAEGDVTPFLADVYAHPDEAPDPPGPGILVGIQGADGSWIVDTLPDEVREAVDGRLPDLFDVSDRDDDRFWVVAGEAASTTDGDVVVWAARETTGLSRSLSDIDLLFLLGGAVLVGLFAVAASVFVRSAMRPVEQSRRRERQFVSDAAHELRTPLAGLRAQLELTRRHLSDPVAATADLGRAEESTARLGELAANLLELARIDEGTPAGSATATEVRAAFLAAIDDIRVTPAASGVTLDHESPAVMPEARVAVDAVSFGRIVRNLLANAVTAVAADGHITTTLVVDSEQVTLTVEDDGPGIPADLLPRALQRFARGDGSGSGLGLALVDALARAAGGTVELSNAARGLRVVVMLPFVHTNM